MAEDPANEESEARAEIDRIRQRALKCRHFAEIYASDVSGSLVELAVELDKQADRLDAKRTAAEADRPEPEAP